MSRAKLALVHFLVALQIALAISYYAWRTDPLDERFAWRMFSVERLAGCQVSFLRGDPGAPINLYREFHEAWVSIARRGRRQVIEAMAAHLCQKEEGARITVVAKCRTIEGPLPISAGSFNLCETGAL